MDAIWLMAASAPATFSESRLASIKIQKYCFFFIAYQHNRHNFGQKNARLQNNWNPVLVGDLYSNNFQI
jgi:hypothetical protein